MKEYTCIVCPTSCRITVEEKNGELIITGNTCKRGEDFARDEYLCPKRMLTTTVKIEGGILPRLPVISSEEIPKEKLKECLSFLYGMKVKAPVTCGAVLAENVMSTGVQILASRSMEEKK